MDRMPDVLDLVPSLKAKGEAFALATVVRTVAATAAKAGAKAIIRTDGIDLRRLDRRRLRARRGAEGRARGARRRAGAPHLRPAAGRAAGAWRRGRRGARGRALRQEHLPEPRHDGYFHRAGAASPADRDLRLEPGGGGARRPRGAARLLRYRLRPARGAGAFARGRPAHRRLCAPRRPRRRALYRRLDPEPRRRGGADGGARDRRAATSLSSAAA